MLEFVHVDDEFVATCERLVAHLADVGLFAGMDAHVNGQFILACQCLAAYCALECLVRCRCTNEREMLN